MSAWTVENWFPKWVTARSAAQPINTQGQWRISRQASCIIFLNAAAALQKSEKLKRSSNSQKWLMRAG